MEDGEMALFPKDDIESDKAARVQLKSIRIGTIRSLGGRAMEGIIPRDWFSMATWDERHGPAPEAFWRTLVADRGANGNMNPPSWYKRSFEYELSNSGKGDVAVQRIIQFGKSSMTREFFRRVQSVIWNRRLVITDMGALVSSRQHKRGRFDYGIPGFECSCRCSQATLELLASWGMLYRWGNGWSEIETPTRKQERKSHGAKFRWPKKLSQ
jgi:hypothetical protein